MRSGPRIPERSRLLLLQGNKSNSGFNTYVYVYVDICKHISVQYTVVVCVRFPSSLYYSEIIVNNSYLCQRKEVQQI